MCEENKSYVVPNYHYVPMSVHYPPVYPHLMLPLPSYGHGPSLMEYPSCSSSPESSTSSSTIGEEKGARRPFKVLPKNSLALAINRATNEALLTGEAASALAYAQYREQCLSRMEKDDQEANANMRRILTPKSTDPEYLKKRKKNNESARKSRQARKAKEDELAIRVSFLEQENLALKIRLEECLKERNVLRNAIVSHNAIGY